MPKITLIPSAPKEYRFRPNDVVTLVKVDDNNVDKYAIAAMMDGEQVAWVADSDATVIKGTFSAQEARTKWLEHPKCAGVSAVVRKSGTYRNQRGEDKRRYEADIYIIPVRETTSKETPVMECKIGGLTARHQAKNTLAAMIQQNKDDLSKLADNINLVLRMRKEASGPDTCCLYFAEETEKNKSIGEVQNPTEELLDMVRKGHVTARFVKPHSSNGCIVSVSGTVEDANRFYPAIDAAVARCAAQSSVLEKRVAHMMQSGFTDKQIIAVLDQTPTLGAERASVPNPKTPYIQLAGTNLADAVAYIRRGKLVQLKGEKGSGKNTLIETACWLLGRPLCRVQGNDDISKMDFEGSRTLKDGSTDFELSEMFQTLQVGGIVVIDEVNMIRANVLADLHSLTDGSRSINVSGYGLVKMDPHSCIVYTRNEGYVGTSEMNPATVDRGPVITVKQESDLAQLLAHAVPTAKKEDIEICCKVSDGIKKSIQEGSALTPDAVTIRGYIDALECADDIPLKRGLLHNVAYKLPEGPESMAVEAIINTHCA